MKLADCVGVTRDTICVEEVCSSQKFKSNHEAEEQDDKGDVGPDRAYKEDECDHAHEEQPEC